MKQPERLVLYMHDIQLITGCKEKAAYSLTRSIRKKYRLSNRMFIPIEIFCEYTGIKEESVRRMLFEEPG